MQPITWPSDLDQSATKRNLRRNRPLPSTVRPCDHKRRSIERAEPVTVPFAHVVGCCALGAMGWIGLFAAGRALLDVLPLV